MGINRREFLALSALMIGATACKVAGIKLEPTQVLSEVQKNNSLLRLKQEIENLKVVSSDLKSKTLGELSGDNSNGSDDRFCFPVTRALTQIYSSELPSDQTVFYHRHETSKLFRGLLFTEELDYYRHIMDKTNNNNSYSVNSTAGCISDRGELNLVLLTVQNTSDAKKNKFAAFKIPYSALTQAAQEIDLLNQNNWYKWANRVLELANTELTDIQDPQPTKDMIAFFNKLQLLTRGELSFRFRLNDDVFRAVESIEFDLTKTMYTGDNFMKLLNNAIKIQSINRLPFLTFECFKRAYEKRNAEWSWDEPMSQENNPKNIFSSDQDYYSKVIYLVNNKTGTYITADKVYVKA